MNSDLELPSWLPRILVEKATEVRARAPNTENPINAIELLQRLTSDPRMEEVWKQFDKKKRKSDKPTDKYFHQASYFWASRARSNRLQAAKLRQKGGYANEYKAQFLEDEAKSVFEQRREDQSNSQWSEQDRGVEYFFHHAYYYALCLPIQLISSHELARATAKIWNVGVGLENDAEILHSFGMEEEAHDLERIAAQCKEHSYWIEADEDDPWLVQRHRGDRQLRGYVAWLSPITRQLFGTPLYGILAITTNVAFKRDDVTGPKIREMLRDFPDPGV